MRRGCWRTCTTGSRSTNTPCATRSGSCRSNAAGCRSRWRSRCRAWACARCGRCSPCRAMRWRGGFRSARARPPRCAARRCACAAAVLSCRRTVSKAASSSTTKSNPARRCCSRCGGWRRISRPSSPGATAACSASRWCWNTNVAQHSDSAGRPAHAAARCGDVVRTRARAAGAGASAGAGARLSPGARDELPPFVPAARDLFETRAQQDVPWPQLRERLRARLGDDAVHGIGHSPEHRPERASRMAGRADARCAAAARLAAAACVAVARSRACSARRARTHRERLVGRRRCAPRLLRGGDLAGPARLGLSAPRANRGPAHCRCCTGGSHEPVAGLCGTALPVELQFPARGVQCAGVVRAREAATATRRWRSPTNARWPASCARSKRREATGVPLIVGSEMRARRRAEAGAAGGDAGGLSRVVRADHGGAAARGQGRRIVAARGFRTRARRACWRCGCRAARCRMRADMADAAWVRAQFPRTRVAGGASASRAGRRARLRASAGAVAATRRCRRWPCGDVHMHVRSRRALQDTMTAIRLRTHAGARPGARCSPTASATCARARRWQRSIRAELLAESVRIARRCTLRPAASCATSIRANWCRTGTRRRDWLRELVEPASRRAGRRRSRRQRTRQGARADREGTGAHRRAGLRVVLPHRARHRALRAQRATSCARAAARRPIRRCATRWASPSSSPGRWRCCSSASCRRSATSRPTSTSTSSTSGARKCCSTSSQRYGRERAALAAVVIRYRGAQRGARRGAGARPAAGPGRRSWPRRWIAGAGDMPMPRAPARARLRSGHRRCCGACWRVAANCSGFRGICRSTPGGFVISEQPLSTLVPVENAAMDDRTVIQWDKDDLEALKLLKVDCLALGMLTCVRKTLRSAAAQRAARHRRWTTSRRATTRPTR